jgi:hypothetical protein
VRLLSGNALDQIAHTFLSLDASHSLLHALQLPELIRHHLFVEVELAELTGGQCLLNSSVKLGRVGCGEGDECGNGRAMKESRGERWSSQAKAVVCKLTRS